jgi:hypothetical protein
VRDPFRRGGATPADRRDPHHERDDRKDRPGVEGEPPADRVGEGNGPDQGEHRSDVEGRGVETGDGRAMPRRIVAPDEDRGEHVAESDGEPHHNGADEQRRLVAERPDGDTHNDAEQAYADREVGADPPEQCRGDRGGDGEGEYRKRGQQAGGDG